ncbi:MAG: peptidoglycan editing factor PgeF [Desulfobacterales bacterium]|nr:peptidoglycan editing factor PgeF [Desulfobacterales bacterium]
MILTYKNGVSFYQFENLAQCSEIRHGIFTRHFGCSPAPFDSLNVSCGLGDADAHIKHNRQAIARAIGSDALITARQVHSDQVLVLTPDQIDGGGLNDGPAGIGDALVTGAAGIFLMIQLADCQSILLYDATRKIVANIHSGWRGSIRNIVEQTVAAMHKHFDCDPAHLMAGIGPSLGPCCAEFVHYRKEIPKTLWSYKLANHHFDFWAISRDQLADVGIPSENIEISNICTRCNTALFFSYRAEGQTGRFASVIGLNH